MAVQTLSYGTSPFNQQRVYTLLCDTVSDLPSGTYDGVTISQGWTAKIIQDGTEYISNSSGTWILQPGSTQIVMPDVYDKSQVDALLAPITDDIDDIQALDIKQTSALENLINTGSKNYMSVTSGGVTSGRWVDIPVNMPAGSYRISFQM